MDEFTKEYASLKQEYSLALSAAIRGGEVQKVLDANSKMSSLVRNFLKVLADKKQDIDYTTIEQLKADLIAHQQEFDRISQSEDKIKTLKLIQADKADKLKDAYSMYYFYLFSLICLCFLIVYLVFVTNSSAMEGGGIFLKKRLFIV
jgi:uncharacterized membrane protein (DUF106 family)